MSNLDHRSNRQQVDFGRPNARTDDVKAALRHGPEESLCHLGSRGVARAQDQHTALCHGCSPRSMKITK
jgi:hypothetical protein